MANVYASFGVLGIEWLLYMCPLGFKDWMAIVYVSFGAPRTEWLLYMHPWGFKDWMAIEYVSFGVPRTKWLLYMCPLELQKVRSVKCSTKNLYVLQHMGHKPL
jgi:hypothetical protein